MKFMLVEHRPGMSPVTCYALVIYDNEEAATAFINAEFYATCKYELTKEEANDYLSAHDRVRVCIV